MLQGRVSVAPTGQGTEVLSEYLAEMGAGSFTFSYTLAGVLVWFLFFNNELELTL